MKEGLVHFGKWPPEQAHAFVMGGYRGPLDPSDYPRHARMAYAKRGGRTASIGG